MRFRGLIFANLFRKKFRFVLTIGSFAVALFLFGLLTAVRGAFNQGVDVAGADRLVIVNRVSIIQSLPLSYRDRILRIPGVKLVTYSNWFGGVYQDERNFFPQFAIDVDTQRQVYPEYIVPDEEWKKFAEDREGAVVGAALAKRFGWKIGDRIPLKSSIWPGSWEFNLDAIYHGRREKDDETQFWFHWKRLDEQVSAAWKISIGAGWYVLRIENPDDAPRVAKAIDAEFANSSSETKTDTEKSFAAGFVKQMGNVEFLIMTIGAVVFFTLLLVTGNTMAIAVRERTAELAVLKAVGFSDRFVLLLVLGESLIIAVVGGGLGLLIAKLLIPVVGYFLRGILPYFVLTLTAIVGGVAFALIVGAAAGVLPAIGAMRLRVVDALRRV